MKTIINPTILQLALEQAAKEIYQFEVIDPEMEDAVIGPGEEFETAEDWVEDRIKTWIESVEFKFKPLGQSEKIEIDEKTITSAILFYKLKLGEAININKNTVVTRVPGGWIWQSAIPPCSSSFIPYNDEFLSIIKGTVQ